MLLFDILFLLLGLLLAVKIQTSKRFLSLTLFSLYFFSEDTAKRRTQKSKSFKEVEKFDVFVLEKSSGCKFRSLQLLLFAIMSAAFLTLLYTPSVYEHQLQSSSR
jgi:hypothetical protein